MRIRQLAALIAAAGLSACQPANAPTASEEPGATPGPSTASSSPSASSETARDAVPASATSTTISEATDDATPGDATPGDATPGDDCGASKVSARWLNALPTADVKAAIAKAVGDRPIRYYGQGDPITMDFSPQRLNVELGKDGRIKLFRCG